MLITETEISKKIGRSVKSPIRISNLEKLYLNQEEFLDNMSPFFKELPWDQYDARRMQVEFLKKKFPKSSKKIQDLFKDYFLGKSKIDVFRYWISKLNKKSTAQFKKIKPWRRRSVCQFKISETEQEIQVLRKIVQQFTQETNHDDYRSLPRVFEESPDHHVENAYFLGLLGRIFHLVKEVQPKAKSITVTAHFMSVKATSAKPGNNSPEGAHEDGADFIVSALVINRKNINGGESQIIEKVKSGEKEVIYKHTLQPGEFVFQADTGEEKIYGNDLWHHVTPFNVADASKGEGWRDIIGFDIMVGY